MKLWLISQKVYGGYDTYDSEVVAAETEAAARETPPRGPDDGEAVSSWAEPAFCKVEYLGEAKPGTEAGVICACFHAG